MSKLIKQWSDLIGLESATHKIVINEKYGCSGWIVPKDDSDDSDYYGNRAYLSTHLFYRKSYKGYNNLLRKFGFDVEIVCCDEEAI